jgi:dienelactone hydrolase
MKVKIIFFLMALAITQNAFSQCNLITVQEVTNYTPFALDSLIESDGLRNGPDYNDATLFFPNNSNNSLKSVVLVPGFQASQSSINTWAKYLASRGFICMTIGTNSLFDSPYLRADALIDGMETIRQENNRVSSPLYQKIDTNNIAVGGWSMGGGGAQLAAKIDPRIRAVIAIAPWLNQSTLSPSDLNHNSPVLIISGQIDAVAYTAWHSDVHYNYTPSTTNKLLFEISGGTHYTPLYPSWGNGDVGNIAFAWLKLHLDENICYCEILSADSLDQNSTATKYLNNLNCSDISITNIASSDLNFQISPNPVSNEFTTEFSGENKRNYLICDLLGRKVRSGKVNSGDKINIRNFTTGSYFLIIDEQTIKFIKE